MVEAAGVARTDLELLSDLVEADTASPKAMDCDQPEGRQILVGPLADVLRGGELTLPPPA